LIVSSYAGHPAEPIELFNPITEFASPDAMASGETDGIALDTNIKRLIRTNARYMHLRPRNAVGSSSAHLVLFPCISIDVNSRREDWNCRHQVWLRGPSRKSSSKVLAAIASSLLRVKRIAVGFPRFGVPGFVLADATGIHRLGENGRPLYG
jgi:hypothetical protein